MNVIEHEAYMEMLMKKKRGAIIFIALIFLAFLGYFFLIRPMLKAYI